MTQEQVDDFIFYLCIGDSIGLALAKAGVDYTEYYKKKWNKDPRIEYYLEKYKEKHKRKKM